MPLPGLTQVEQRRVPAVWVVPADQPVTGTSRSAGSSRSAA